MSTPTSDRLLWPDLERFGASLTVAVNPSTGKNLLQLRIHDIARFAAKSGHTFESAQPESPIRPIFVNEEENPFAHELKARLEQAGFVQTSRPYESVLQRDAPQQYEDFARDYANAPLFDRFAGEGGFFISPRIDISVPRMQEIIPAVTRDDYVKRPLQPVRHQDGSLYDPGIRIADTRLPEAWFKEVTNRLQQMPDAEPGVFYTIPHQRNALALEDSSANNDLLYALTYVPRIDLEDAPRLCFEKLANGGIQPFSINHKQISLHDLRGYDLNAAKTVGAGFVSEADAILANGNRREGVVREHYPNSWPIGTSTTQDGQAPLILFVKDARFLPARLNLFTRAALQPSTPQQFRNPVLNTPTPEHIFHAAGHVRTAYACYEDIADKLESATGVYPVDPTSRRFDAAVAISSIVEPDAHTLAAVQASLNLVNEASGHLRNARKELLAKSTMDAGDFEPRFLPLSERVMVRHGLHHIATTDLDRQRQFASFAASVYSEATEKTLKAAVISIRDSLLSKASIDPTNSTLEDVTHAIAAHDDTYMSRIREDAGEKIGGARKDYYRSPLRFDEISGMTARERAALISKDNVWPRPDYAAMREEGRHPVAAYFIKYIRDALPGKPDTAGYNPKRRDIAANQREIANDTDKGLRLQQAFVETVTAYRETFSDVSTLPQLLKAIASLRDRFQLDMAHQVDPAFIADPLIAKRGYGRYGGKIYETIKSGGASIMIERDPEGWTTDEPSKPGLETHSLGTGYKFYSNSSLPEILIRADGNLAPMQARGWSKLSSVAGKALASDGPADVLRQMNNPEQTDRDVFWEWTLPKSRTRRQDMGGETYNVDKPHLSEINRSGIDWRQGKDVDERLFMSVLGMRGVEYGEWLPKAGEESERQAVLNMAFDALCDLAHHLKIPPKAISLGGQLAIGFGSRGRGGWHAPAAHYEPSKETINLTRINGAGFLAHEWAHALSYRIAAAAGVSKTGSIGKTNRIPRDADPAAVSLRHMMQNLQSRPMEKDEIRKRLETVTIRGGGASPTIVSVGVAAQQRIKLMTNQINRHLAEHIKESGKFTDESARVIEQSINSNNWRSFEPNKLYDHLDALTDMYAAGPGGNQVAINEARLNLSKDLYLVHSALQKQSVAIDRLERDFAELEGRPTHMWPPEYVTESDYYRCAVQIDEEQKRAKPYWSTTEEMWARFFEAHVERQLLRSEGLKSDYLVNGASSLSYPNDRELDIFSKEFDQLWEKHRTAVLKMTLPAEELARFLRPTDEFNPQQG